MIVINAEGANDVRKLRRLARRLDAEEILDGSEVRELSAPGSRSKPGGSMPGGVIVSPATREAIMRLEHTGLVVGLEYDEA